MRYDIADYFPVCGRLEDDKICLMTLDKLLKMTAEEYADFTANLPPIRVPQRFVISVQPSALQAPEGALCTSNVNHEGQTLAFDAKGFPDLEFLDAPEA